MSKPCGDMIASLTHLPEAPALSEGVQLKRALCIDRQRILQFIQENFGDGRQKKACSAAASSGTTGRSSNRFVSICMMIFHPFIALAV